MSEATLEFFHLVPLSCSPNFPVWIMSLPFRWMRQRKPGENAASYKHTKRNTHPWPYFSVFFCSCPFVWKRKSPCCWARGKSERALSEFPFFTPQQKKKSVCALFSASPRKEKERASSACGNGKRNGSYYVTVVAATREKHSDRTGGASSFSFSLAMIYALLLPLESSYTVKRAAFVFRGFSLFLFLYFYPAEERNISLARGLRSRDWRQTMLTQWRFTDFS